MTMPLTRHRHIYAFLWTTGHFEYSPWQNSQKISQTFQLSLNLLLNKTFLLEYREFPDIYVSQGSVAMRLRCGAIFSELH